MKQIYDLHFCISAPAIIGSICGLTFLSLLAIFRYLSRGMQHVYFDAQDFFHYENGGNRDLPVSAKTGTFGPFLKGYIGATKLLITVAAASIAFGRSPSTNQGVVLAKTLLSG